MHSIVLATSAAALYAAKMAELQTALDQPDVLVEAMEVLRTLIERIVLTPDETTPNGLAIEPFGDLATIMNLASATGWMPGKSAALGAKKKPREAGASEGLLRVVAGARNHRELTTLRTNC